MAKLLALTTVPKGGTTEPKKKAHERIVLIETPPRPDWYIQTTTATGRRVWYLRFQVTGLAPRLYGPFTSRHRALLAFDATIDTLQDVENEMKDVCEERMLKVKYQKVWPPMIEHPVATKGGR
jgi:hypothetical protein